MALFGYIVRFVAVLVYIYICVFICVGIIYVRYLCVYCWCGDGLVCCVVVDGCAGMFLWGRCVGSIVVEML